MVAYGHDHYLSFERKVENVEWKPLKNQLSCAVIGQWVTVRGFHDSGDSIVNGMGECGGT